MGWIGTGEVNRDMGLKLGETQRQVSPGSSPASQFTYTVLVPVHYKAVAQFRTIIRRRENGYLV